MTGRKEYKEVLYLIDFGLSKKYIDSKTGEHVKFKNNHNWDFLQILNFYNISKNQQIQNYLYHLQEYLHSYFFS